MLFLYRPRETWMPFARPMSGTQKAAYNRSLQMKFESTRRAPRPVPAPAPTPQLDVVDALQRLAGLQQTGQLTDEEFFNAKQKVLGR